ncbi:MAG: hypothetical protein DME22_26710 [Verrucomicrobia bacterium]|nr:MAG: hypothetical protein DME22_26710 [Verrucomicrobiota bacterium]PYJ98015.1 MAG: hypothetical protein DME23_13170 [Verrucomicrobiota bacterium]
MLLGLPNFWTQHFNSNNHTINLSRTWSVKSSPAADSLANTFARYETAIENRLFRALNQLKQMQRLRRGERLPLPDGEPLASFGNPPQHETA